MQSFLVLFFSCVSFFFSCSTQHSELGRKKNTYILQEEVAPTPDWHSLGKSLQISPELMPSIVKLFVQAMRHGLQSRYYRELCHGKVIPSLEQKNLDFGALEEKELEPIVVSTSQGTRTLASFQPGEPLPTSNYTLDTFLGLAAPLSQTCAALKDYLVSSNYSYHQRKKKQRQQRRMRRGFRVRKRISWAQKISFNRLVLGLRVRSFGEFHTLSKRALTTKSCPRNLSAALSLVAFNYFPKESAVKHSIELFQHTKHCLRPKHSFWSTLHLRHGLYAIYQGKHERAHTLLVDSMNASSPKEVYRALFWLGWLENKKGISKEENTAWQLLSKKYPLSYYSIFAHTSWEDDILDLIAEAHSHKTTTKSENRPEWNPRIRWLEALLFAGERKRAISWAEWMAKDVKDLEFPLINYVSSILLRNEIYRQNITLLRRYYQYHPERISLYGLRALYPRPFFKDVHEKTRTKIHTNLVMSLIRQESAFDPKAVSPARAKGLMQVIPRTARHLLRRGHQKLMDPKANTQMGVKYLERLATRFDNKMELVLAAYNAGPQRVKKWLKRIPHQDNLLLWIDLIPYRETRNYVVSILRNNYWYERLYGPLNIDQEEVLNSRLVQELLQSREDATPVEDN